MKTVKILLSSIALIAFSSFVSAERYDRDYTYAQVVDVQPVYETYRVPQNRRVCEDRRGYRDNRRYSSQRHSSGGGAVLGGIIGGLIGNRFGKGHGRDAATAVGVLAGAAIGSESKHNNRRYNRHNRHNRHNRNRNNRHCYTQRGDYYEEQRIAGYDVSYDYNGRIYHTRLQNHPGDRVRIDVNVSVAQY